MTGPDPENDPDPSAIPDHALPVPPADPVLIRPMVPGDVEAALDLMAEVAAEAVWVGTQSGFDRDARRQRWLDGLASPGARSLVVQDAASLQVLGHGSVQREPYGVADLGMLLAAGARGRGVGGRLLDALVDAARELGAHKVALQVWAHNEPALRLYLSRGFVIEGRLRAHYPRASGQVWDALIMGLLLDPDVVGPERLGALPDAPQVPESIPVRATPTH